MLGPCLWGKKSAPHVVLQTPHTLFSRITICLPGCVGLPQPTVGRPSSRNITSSVCARPDEATLGFAGRRQQRRAWVGRERGATVWPTQGVASVQLHVGGPEVLHAAWLGIIFCRMSRATKRACCFVFSTNAIVSTRNGVPNLILQPAPTHGPS